MSGSPATRVAEISHLYAGIGSHDVGARPANAGSSPAVRVARRSCRRAEFVGLTQQLLAAGVDAIQLRDKRLDDRRLLQRGRLLRERTRQSNCLFIMNDRPDLAVLSAADGIHVGQEELSGQGRSFDRRSGFPDWRIDPHARAGSAGSTGRGDNYIGCGPTFPSHTKSFPDFAGLEFLGQVSQNIRLPAFAIGGINSTNLPQVLETGVTRVALQHAVVDAPDPSGRGASDPQVTRQREVGMPYEVENKYRIEDVPATAQALIALGTEFSPAIEQIDTYFKHPVRNFAQTDEALRLRRVADQNQITYKGPKIDRSTKTRVELELPLAAGADRFSQYQELLERLDFQPVSEVKKRRQIGHLEWEGLPSKSAWTRSRAWGILLNWKSSPIRKDWSGPKSCVTRLASELGLSAPERRSYLEMLLEKDAEGDSENSRFGVAFANGSSGYKERV